MWLVFTASIRVNAISTSTPFSVIIDCSCVSLIRAIIFIRPGYHRSVCAIPAIMALAIYILSVSMRRQLIDS